MAISTVLEYKQYRSLSGASWDPAIGLLLSAAEAAVSRYARGDAGLLESAERTEDYDGGEPIIWLRAWPVASVASVAQVWADGSTTTIDSGAYLLTGARGTLEAVSCGAFPWGFADGFGGAVRLPRDGGPRWPRGTIRVTYTGGYATVPADLKLAVWQMVDSALASRGVDLVNVSAESLGTISRTAMPPVDRVAAVRALLAPYRRGEFGA